MVGLANVHSNYGNMHIYLAILRVVQCSVYSCITTWLDQNYKTNIITNVYNFDRFANTILMSTNTEGHFSSIFDS